MVSVNGRGGGSGGIARNALFSPSNNFEIKRPYPMLIPKIFFKKQKREVISMQTTQDNIKAIIQFREALLSDEVLYNAFLSSIESALIETPPSKSIEQVSKAVADRIIGAE